MGNFIETLNGQIPRIVDHFAVELARIPKARRILELLSPDELEQLKRQQQQNLLTLADPNLGADAHAALARRIGRFHAIVGLDKEDLILSRDILLESFDRLATAAALTGGDDADAWAAYLNRMRADLDHQLGAYERIQASRQEALLHLTRAVWAEDRYSRFIARLAEILAAHEEFSGCAVCRPNADGVFQFEAVAGAQVEAYCAELSAHPELQIRTEAGDLRGQGPIGLAWRNGKVARVMNFTTDPQARLWREIARRHDIRCGVAVPLRAPGQSPIAVVMLYGSLPGGFIGAHQAAFIGLVETLLGCSAPTLTDLGGHQAVPITVRQHWSALVRNGSLQMLYQPLYDLRHDTIDKVEALARLRDGEALLSPDVFLDALPGDDLFQLYAHGLAQALADRRDWLAQGRDVAISLNLPPDALTDIRYYEATRIALETYACPPARLMLEVLENEGAEACQGADSLLGHFKTLGVQLAQDDLGSGHSGLSRLRGMPFDWIKIDRGLVLGAESGNLDTLRFIYQLTRLCHALGKLVLAEGIEKVDLLDALSILDVDAAQGYAVDHPLPAGRLLARLGQPALPPGYGRGESRLARIAHFVVWESHLRKIGEIPQAADALAGQLEAVSQAFARDAEQKALVRETIAALRTEGREGAGFLAARTRLAERVTND